MSTNVSYLPQKGTPEYEEIGRLFPVADERQLREWVGKYGFLNRKSFVDSVRNRYEINRVPNLGNRGWEPSEVNIPLTIATTKQLRTFVIINDTQNPFQDVKSIKLMERFLQEIDFHYLLYNGDMTDLYLLSKFDKNPGRIENIQQDVDNTRAMFDRHSRLFPNVERYLLDGNHEDRWRRYLWTKARELDGIRALDITELFTLGDFGIKHIDYEQGLKINGVFLVLHGDIASIHSGYTAKRMFEKHGGCGMVGHCHRGGSFYKRDRFGTWGWWENFCLCHLNPDWIKNPNWVQGFSLVHFIGERFWVEQIPIIGHTIMYGGKLFK